MEWEYWNPDHIDSSLPGNGCPHYEESTTGESDDTEEEDEEESLPGFEAWLLIFAILFAVSFRRKLTA